MASWLWAVVALGGAVLVLLAVAWWLLRGMAGETKVTARRIGQLPWRAKARLAWALLRDRRVPLWVRLVIPALVLYLAMPLDIIPDFIPIIGALDDVVVVLIALRLILRSIPTELLDEHISAQEQRHSELRSGERPVR